ncbi:MAG: inositol monophosphatase family protein [Dehalococcoidia bacterium]
MVSDGRSLPRSARGQDALAVAEQLARDAGALIRRAALLERPAEHKGRTNLVTATDHASEALIIEGIESAFPSHAILSEESRPDTSWERGWVWVIDPLDGTRNFVSGIPLYCVNIGLVRDGEPVLGATYDPHRDVCISGGPGLGVHADGRPVRASQAADLAASVVTADLGYYDERATMMLATVQEMIPQIQAVRIIGSAALGLAWAAAGLSDLNLHSLVFPWDIAAGMAMLREGGGVLFDRDGGPVRLDSQGIVAGSSAVAAEFFARFGARPWR